MTLDYYISVEASLFPFLTFLQLRLQSPTCSFLHSRLSSSAFQLPMDSSNSLRLDFSQSRKKPCYLFTHLPALFS